MRILPCGPHARLIEHDDPTGYAMGLQAAVESGLITNVVDIVPAEATVLVTFDRAPDDGALSRVTALPPSQAPAESVEISVAYDGEDLDEVATVVGLTTDEIIVLHSASTYTVAFCGFAPGFAYLTGTDPRLHLPRRATPRTRVPAGSVAIAAGYSAVYPLSSPGGWHLLGRTDARIFDALSDTPALLRPGMRVRFVPTSDVGARHSQPAAATPVDSSPVIEVVDPGPLTLIEDLGRPGHGDIAVGISGAFDRRAHRLANRIVGNDESAAALESLGGGLALRALRHCVVAVTGAAGPVLIDGLPADRGTPLHLTPGQVITLGSLAAGLRSVIAIRGGITAPSVLGSRSRDTLSGLGPHPLAPGETVSVNDAYGVMNVDHVPLAALPQNVELRLHPGPRGEWLSARSRQTLSQATFRVGSDSDRIGVRLDGPTLDVRESTRLASEGVVRGALQVPPDGRPVILGPDHPVTGGYPVVGVVDDVDALAQAPPGTPVRFAPIGW